MGQKGRIRTSVRDGKSETSEPYGRISDSSEGLPGGKEEVSGDRVGRSGKLNVESGRLGKKTGSGNREYRGSLREGKLTQTAT